MMGLQGQPSPGLSLPQGPGHQPGVIRTPWLWRQPFPRVSLGMSPERLVSGESSLTLLQCLLLSCRNVSDDAAPLGLGGAGPGGPGDPRQWGLGEECGLGLPVLHSAARPGRTGLGTCGASWNEDWALGLGLVGSHPWALGP